MATAEISMDDALFAHVLEAAGENLSEWIATACLHRLLKQGVRAAVIWEREHPAEAAAARAEEAARQLEADAESEVRYQAEEAARRRGGDGAEPTAEEIAAAEARVRVLFERADRKLRGQQEGEQ
ncbi:MULTISPECIES: hypothetical protein [Nocardia]|uniref:hypothetical protein n=1 Tax=Nocardia TaxID=1817 RepID=UPI002457CE5C|nr:MULTISPECIES: hypothetical protein [Nocardia]